jgi:acetolactate synthase-like protein
LDRNKIARVTQKLEDCQRPMFILGSQVVLDIPNIKGLITAIEKIGAPVYLSGMARGLLGRDHPLHMRHKRRAALKEADFVLLAGVPVDFRLGYGQSIRSRSFYTSFNRSPEDLTMNRRPDIGILGDPGAALRELASFFSNEKRWLDWIAELEVQDQARNEEIAGLALQPTANVNPLDLFRQLDPLLPNNTILVADGGDFVATASYILQPPGPLRWLDPGPFGTLGVGAGFALAAKLTNPEAEVWIIYTFTRHDTPVIALVGNDASWAQIARDQVDLLGDDVATELRYTDYHAAAAGFGGIGIKLDDPELVIEVAKQAQETAASGKPILINTIIGKTDFRKGSISV